MALARRRRGAGALAFGTIVATTVACTGAARSARDEAPPLDLYAAVPDGGPSESDWTSFDTSGAEGCVKTNLHVDFGACRWGFDVLADAELVHCTPYPGTVGGNFKVDTTRGRCQADEARDRKSVV